MSAMVRRLLITAVVLLFVEAAFWSAIGVIHAERMTPERGAAFEPALYIALTAAGPFAPSIMELFDKPGTALQGCAVVLVLISAGLLGRGTMATRMLGYAGVATWFFLGFMFAAARISLMFSV